MTLPNDYDDVKISEKINDSISRFVQNDQSMTRRSGGVPGTWTRSWYNDGDQTKFYKKGDAVWVNVYGVDDIIRDREADIRFYAIGNPSTRAELERLDSIQDRS